MQKLRIWLTDVGKEAAHRFLGSAEAGGLVSVPDLADAWHRFRIVAGLFMFILGMTLGMSWQWEAAFIVAALGALVAWDGWFRLFRTKTSPLMAVVLDITVVGVAMVVVQLKIVGVAAPLVYMLVLAVLLLPWRHAVWVMPYALAWGIAAIIGVAILPLTPAVSEDTVALIAYVTFSVLTIALAALVSSALERSTTARRQFLAAISHEIRTPLTSILGWARLLREDGVLEGAEVDDALGMIESESEEVSHLVEDLITAVQLDSGAVAVQQQIVTVGEEIDAVLRTTYCEAVKDFEIHGEPATAIADGLRVRQILRNLLCNAVIHGGNRAWISTAQQNGECLIAVSDTGPGVHKALEKRIFDPYFRARRSRGPQPAIGIGLSVSRDLATMMKGDLVYRRVAGITVFELSLPAPDHTLVEA